MGFLELFFPVLQALERLACAPDLRRVTNRRHPAAFFLVAGYSESLFLMALLGFIYWSAAEGSSAKFWAAVHGIVMSATRIVGIVCAAFPLVHSVFQTGWRGLLEPREWLRKHS